MLEKLGLEFYMMGKQHETRAQVCFFLLWQLKATISILRIRLCSRRNSSCVSSYVSTYLCVNRHRIGPYWKAKQASIVFIKCYSQLQNEPFFNYKYLTGISSVLSFCRYWADALSLLQSSLTLTKIFFFPPVFSVGFGSGTLDCVLCIWAFQAKGLHCRVCHFFSEYK